MRRLLAASLLAAGVGLTAPWAGTGQPETVRVEGKADREPTDLTVFSTTIRADRFQDRITTVAELLQESVGLHVRSFGGLGSFATVSIRGSTAEQVNVFIDGVLQNSALGGGVNLADLPLDHVEAIEVYRGFTPAFLDASAIGGAINIRTRIPVAARSTSGKLSYGSYNTMKVGARTAWHSTSGARERDILIGFTGRATRGDFRFFDNNGTPAVASDDGFRTRRNNRFGLAELLASAGWGLLSGGRLELQAVVTGRRQGVPGIDAFQSLKASSSMTRARARVKLDKNDLLDSTLSLSLSAHYDRTSQGFTDRLGDTTAGLSTDTRDLLQAAGPSLLLRWSPEATGPVRQTITLHSSGRFETADRRDRLNPRPDRGHAERLGFDLTLEDEIHLAGGRFVVTPSIRWDRFSSRFDAPDGVPVPAAARDAEANRSGKLGVAWFLGDRLALRANIGRFFRVPSFTEIFGDQGSVKGSGDLVPEEGLNTDLGLTWRSGRRGLLDHLFLQGVVFRSKASDLIQFVQTSQSQVAARNTGAARITGLELSASFGLFAWFDASLDYTYQVAEDRSDTFRRGSDLPGRPRHEASTRAGLRRSWGHPYYTFDYTSPNFFDTAAASLEGSRLDRDQLRVPGRYLHGIGFSGRVGSRLEYTIEVDNLFNVKTVDIVRYPLPGRTVQAEIRISLP